MNVFWPLRGLAMTGIIVLLTGSALGVVISLTLPGYGDLLMLAGPMLLASLWLLLRRRLGQAEGAKPNWVVVDGSNVMHWQDGVPQIATVRAVVEKLKAAGYTPGVVFDANAGYKLVGKYKHDTALGKMLGLPGDRVMVVPKGTPADPMILESARSLGARVVSNDRYRDWAETHPEVTTPGHVIAGGYRDGQLWLGLG
jgi:hypothetical protein